MYILKGFLLAKWNILSRQSLEFKCIEGFSRNGQKLGKKAKKKKASQKLKVPIEHPEDILLFPHNNASNERSFSKQ